MTLQDPRIERHGEGFRLVYDDVYATDIDDLWDAITDPARLARWMAVYTGELALAGEWRVANPGEEPWGRGVVTACDPPRAFTTTWQAEDEPETILDVRLEPAPGGTRLVLTHDGVRSVLYGAGWQVHLEQLAQHAADPGADPWGEDAWQSRFDALRGPYDERFGAL